MSSNNEVCRGVVDKRHPLFCAVADRRKRGQTPVAHHAARARVPPRAMLLEAAQLLFELRDAPCEGLERLLQALHVGLDRDLPDDEPRVFAALLNGGSSGERGAVAGGGCP